jgi:ubiquitin-like domain-containing CTD phosphatase 1
MAEIIQSSETSFSAAAPQDDSSAVPEAPPLEFNTTFQGQKLTLCVKRDGVVADLKAAITDETQVPAKRQKLIGLVKGALPPDESRLAELVDPRGETPPTKFLLMGTPDDKLFVDPKDWDDLPEVVNDLAPDFDYQGLCDEWHRSRRHAATLSKFTAKTEINWLTPRRKGKKLLVLDLDHTLLDFNRHDAPTDVSANSKRPSMDAFLEAVYEDYDFVIWSQTHWRWLELKLTALGMMASPKYKICL